MSGKTPDHMDVSLMTDSYRADCTLCGWATQIKPSSDNGWWFHSLRVHAWHFCPPRK